MISYLDINIYQQINSPGESLLFYIHLLDDTELSYNNLINKTVIEAHLHE
jgi:hypothetical protein